MAIDTATRNYSLSYAQAEQFYDAETPEILFRKVAKFVRRNNLQHVLAFNLYWNEETNYSGTLVYEDVD